jgi:hypothetical protein
MEHKYNASNAAVPIKRVWESDGAIDDKFGIC